MRMYNNKDLENPFITFSIRTENIRQRILVLQNDLTRVNSYISYAIIENEIEILIDDYVKRMQIIHSKDKESEGND